MSDEQDNQVDLTDATNDELKAMGLPPAFTMDQLKGFMSPEEIEQELKSADPIVKVEASTAAPVQEKGEGSDEEDEDEADDDQRDNGGASAEADEAQPAPADVPEADPVVRQFDNSPHEAIINGLKDARRELLNRWQDGDLTDSEYEEKLDTLNDQAVEAKAAIKENERQQAADIADYQKAWYAKAEKVLADNPAYKDMTPVPALDGESTAILFDRACRILNTDHRFATLSFDQRLAEADRMTRTYVKQKTGQDIAPAKSTGKVAGKEVDKDLTPAERVQAQGKRPDPVRTLGGVTAATETEIENSKFAAIDNQGGLAAERAYAAMSPAEKEAYLRGE